MLEIPGYLNVRTLMAQVTAMDSIIAQQNTKQYKLSPFSHTLWKLLQ